VLLRGLGYRAGRSAVVGLLATLAVAAAVLVPGYTRAAQQSVLTDRLAAAPAAATGLTVAAAGTAATAPAAHQPVAAAQQAVERALVGHPELAGVLAPAVGGTHTEAVVTGGSEPVSARLAYRDGVCDQLAVTGDCPAGPGQVLVSARTAEAYQIGLGDRLGLQLAQARHEVRVVGSYRPRDPAAGYWGRTVYFTHGGFDPATGAPRGDALFTGAEDDVLAAPAGVVELALTYPLRPGAVRLDGLPALRADLATLAAPGEPETGALRVETDLPAVLADAARDQRALGQTIPVLAVPLLLLAGFVLFLLVAAVTEERAPEIGLAKLRGLPGGRTLRFGLGEVLVLLVVAAPVGIAVGLGAVELTARLALAGGTHAELRWPVFLAAGGALAVAAGAALAAGWRTLRRGVLDLLRRVPERARWRAGLVEGGLVALAAAALVVAVGDAGTREAGPGGALALLAPALVAVVAGIAVARLVRAGAAGRLRRTAAGRGRSGRGGRIAGLLAAAQLARRPAAPRVITVLTVAIALLAFAGYAWDLAAQARQDHAVDALGADRVYTVQARHPAALVEAVHAADPAGTAMAVVRATGQYAGEQIELLAVEVPRLAGVVRWRGYPAAERAGRLRPQEPAPLWLAGRIEVDAEVRELGDDPVRLSALVSVPGEPPAAVSLGTLDPDTRRYAAPLPECAAPPGGSGDGGGTGPAGCRLLGLRLARTGVTGPVDATVEVTAIRSGAAAGADELAPLPARFDQPDAWQAGPETRLSPGAGLLVAVAGSDTGALAGDVVVEYQDQAATLPAVLAGPPPAEDPAAVEFTFPGLAERPEPFTVVDRVDHLPRAGPRGLLFDLEPAIRSAERRVALSDSAGLRYEVWAGPAAPTDLPHRLATAGVPVLSAESVTGTADLLSRRAPALGWWLALLAAVAALALALGVVALSARVGAADRRAELAALRVAGVSARVLRRARRREYASLLGWPLLVGVGVGLATAAALLPGLPLVETGTTGPVPGFRPGLGVLPVALALAVAGLVVAALPGLRLPPAEAGRPGTGPG
jgi:hypothetical protein